MNDFGERQIIAQLPDDGRNPAAYIADTAESARSNESGSRRTLFASLVETLVRNTDVSHLRLWKSGRYNGIAQTRTGHSLAAIKMTVDREQMLHVVKRPCAAKPRLKTRFGAS